MLSQIVALVDVLIGEADETDWYQVIIACDINQVSRLIYILL